MKEKMKKFGAWLLAAALAFAGTGAARAEAVASLYKDSALLSTHETIASAVAAWNAAETGAYTIAIEDGDYSVSDLVLFQTAGRALTFKAKNDPVDGVCKVNFTRDSESVSGCFILISSGSSYAGAGINIKGIKFDLSTGSAGCAVYLGGGGSGKADAKFQLLADAGRVDESVPSVTRYCHEITVDSCVMVGAGAAYATEGISTGTGTSGITVKDCSAENLQYLCNGYFVNHIAGVGENSYDALTVTGCTLRGCKTMINEQSGCQYGGPVVVVEDCDVEFYHDYGIRVRGGSLTVSDCKFSSTYTGTAAGGAIVCRSPTGDETPRSIVVENSTFDKKAASMYPLYAESAGWTYNGESVTAKTGYDFPTSAETVIEIATPTDLVALSAAVNGGKTYAGEKVVLTADLDMTGIEFTPIGNVTSYPSITFKGTFDGQNHTISNLKASDFLQNYATAGLFGSLCTGAVVQNLKLVNPEIRSSHYAGAIVGYISEGPVKVINCSVEGGSVKSTPELLGSKYDNGDKVGGILGYSTANGSVTGCSVDGLTITAYRDIGGIAGYSGGTVSGNSVKNTTIVQDNTNGYKDYSITTVGAICGGGTVPASDANVSEKVEFVKVNPAAPVVDVPTEVVTDTEVAKKIEQNTKVEGVQLSVKATDEKPAGVQAVIATAKTQDQEFAAAVEAAAEVSVKVEVKVEPTEYVAPTAEKGKVAFKLTPKATVTVKQNEQELKQEVPVTNDMIDRNQKIAVSIYTGFRPATILHNDDNGALIESFSGDGIVYDETTGVATVEISHFSTLLFSQEEIKFFFADENDANLWHVANAAGLAEFRDAVNSGDSFAGKTVVLDVDIDMASVDSWTPIGTNANPFSGVFDGQNHTISNLKHTGAETASQVGLFGLVSGVKNADYTGVDSVWANETFFETNIAESKYTAVVKNLVLEGVAIANTSGDGSSRYTGALAGEALFAYIANITVSGSVSGTKGVGGVVGTLNGSIAKGCVNSATVTANNYNAGGIAGGAQYNKSGADYFSAFVDCSNSGNITTVSEKGGYTGGIVGMAQGHTCTIVKGCSNSGAISDTSTDGGTGIGGIVGRGISTKLIVDCENNGTLTTTAKVEYAGGITGAAVAEIYNSENKSDITISADYLAGIYNYDRGNGGAGGTCVNCTNTGTLTNTNPDGQTYPIGGDTKAAVYSNRTFADVAEVNALIATLNGATEISFENCTVTDKTGTLQLQGNVQRISSDTELCAKVDADSGNKNALTIDVPNVEVVVAEDRSYLNVKGAGCSVTIPANVTVVDVKIEGDGASVVNNGTITRLTLAAAGTASAENNGMLNKLGFGGTGMYNVVNNGTITHQTADSNPYGNEHTVATIVAAKATIDNYGTIEAKANASGVCSYALLFYGGANVVINSYKDSVISADKNGCFIACGSAEAVTLNVEEGAVFKYGETPFTPVSSGKLTVQPMAKPVAEIVGTGAKFATLAEAVEAVEDGQTIKLLTDMTDICKLGMASKTTNPTITFDLNGHTIYNKVQYGSGPTGVTGAKATFIIKNGTIDVRGETLDTCAIHASGSGQTCKSLFILENLTIYGYCKGYYAITGQIDAAYGDVRIMSGNYIIDEKAGNGISGWATAYGGTVQIMGGTFSPTYNVEDYLAPGCYIEEDADGNQIVRVDNSVAEIEGGDKFDSLGDALLAAQDGDTVNLLKDMNERLNVAFETNTGAITLNLNGHVIAGGVNLNASENPLDLALTIKGGTIGSADGESSALYATKIAGVRLEEISAYGAIAGQASCPITIVSGSYHANAAGSPVDDYTNAYLTFYGGAYDYDPMQDATSAFNALAPFHECNQVEGKWIVSESKYPALTPDDDGVYHIATVENLLSFREMVNSGAESFAGKVVKLDANLDLSLILDWTRIGSEANPFKGTFDGQNHTISNLTIVNNNDPNGFFGYVTASKPEMIKNLTFENVSITAVGNVGALAGRIYTGYTVSNVNVTGTIQITGSWYLGGIQGGMTYSKYVDCHVDGLNKANSFIRSINGPNESAHVGGILGHCGEGAVVVDGCTASNITFYVDGAGVGGIIGLLQYGTDVRNCAVENIDIVSGSKENLNAVGYIAGRNVTDSGSKVSTVINSTATDVSAELAEEDYNPPVVGRDGDTNRTLIGTDVEFDENGKVVSGEFELIGVATMNDIAVSDKAVISDPDPQTGKIIVKKVVAEIVETGATYATVQAAVAAVTEDGATVKLLTDVELDAVLNGGAHSITIDGDGHTFTQKAGVEPAPYHWFCFGTQQAPSGAGKSFTFKNATIDGFTSGTYMFRVEECSVTLDNVTFNECAGTYIVLFTHANGTVRNCVFSDNDASDRIIDFNSNADEDGYNDVFVMDNCLIQDNVANGTAIVGFAEDKSVTISNCSFIGNTLNSVNNSAPLYLGDQCGTCTGSLFKDNVVNFTTSSGYDNRVRAAGAIFTWASGTPKGEISGNAFVNNTVVKQNANFLTCYAKSVYSGGYYADDDLAGNYWDGHKPVIAQKDLASADNDIYAEYDAKAVTASTYAMAYELNSDNYGVTVTLPSPYWSDHAAAEYSTPVDTDKKIVTIATPEELALFAKDVNEMKNAYNGYTVNITADIDLSAHDWVSIKALDEGSPYWDALQNVTINGNNHVISGLTIAESGVSEQGFIGVCAGKVTVKDVTFDAADVTAGSRSGIVVGTCYNVVTLDGVSVTDSNLFAPYYAAALIGFTGGNGVESVVRNCECSGVAVASNYEGEYSGTMVGLVNEGDTILLEGNRIKDDCVCDELPGSFVGVSYNDSFAAVPAVAKIDDWMYPTLAAAVEAVPTDGTEATTIKMIADDSYTGKNPIAIATGKKVVLDLNGFTVSYVSDNATNESDSFILNKGDLTVTDTSEKKLGKITAKQNVDWMAGAYTINNFGNYDVTGHFVLEAGTIENTSSAGLAWPINNGVWGTKADTVINGGTIHSVNYVPVRQYYQYGGTKTLTINGGTFVSDNSRAIAIQCNDQTIAETGSYVKVNGGAFNCNGSGMIYFDLHVANINTTGAAIEVKGGTFSNANADAPVVVVDNEGKDQTSAVLSSKFIAGGTYSKEPAADMIADGYEAVAQGTTPETWKVQEKAEEEIEIPVDDSGEAVIPVKVPAEVFEQKPGQEIKDKDGKAIPTPTTTEQKQQFLVTEQPNGLKVWQNVAMGVNGNTVENALATISREPTEAEKAEAAEQGKTVDIVINTPITEFDPPTTTGVTVSYKLLRSVDGGVVWTVVAENLEKPEFPAYTKDDELISAGDTFWKFQAVFESQANAQAE